MGENQFFYNGGHSAWSPFDCSRKEKENEKTRYNSIVCDSQMQHPLRYVLVVVVHFYILYVCSLYVSPKNISDHQILNLLHHIKPI